METALAALPDVGWIGRRPKRLDEVCHPLPMSSFAARYAAKGRCASGSFRAGAGRARVPRVPTIGLGLAAIGGVGCRRQRSVRSLSTK